MLHSKYRTLRTEQRRKMGSPKSKTVLGVSKAKELGGKDILMFGVVIKQDVGADTNAVGYETFGTWLGTGIPVLGSHSCKPTIEESEFSRRLGRWLVVEAETFEHLFCL